MALRTSLDLRNLLVNTIVHQMAGTKGTGGSCLLRFYNGPQPASADDATSGTCLGTIGGGTWGIGWGGSNGTVGATSGTVSLGTSVGYTGTMGAVGTAVWARMITYGTSFFGTSDGLGNSGGSAGTYVIDGDVGTASTSTFVVNSAVFSASGQFSLVGMNLTIG